MDESQRYRSETRTNLFECLLMALGGTLLSLAIVVGVLWAIDHLGALSWSVLLGTALFSFCTAFGLALRWSMWTLLQRDRITRR